VERYIRVDAHSNSVGLGTTRYTAVSLETYNTKALPPALMSSTRPLSDFMLKSGPPTSQEKEVAHATQAAQGA
jgi:hypothetical protein